MCSLYIPLPQFPTHCWFFLLYFCTVQHGTDEQAADLSTKIQSSSCLKQLMELSCLLCEMILQLPFEKTNAWYDSSRHADGDENNNNMIIVCELLMEIMMMVHWESVSINKLVAIIDIFKEIPAMLFRMTNISIAIIVPFGELLYNRGTQILTSQVFDNTICLEDFFSCKQCITTMYSVIVLNNKIYHIFAGNKFTLYNFYFYSTPPPTPLYLQAQSTWKRLKLAHSLSPCVQTNFNTE